MLEVSESIENVKKSNVRQFENFCQIGGTPLGVAKNIKDFVFSDFGGSGVTF